MCLHAVFESHAKVITFVADEEEGRLVIIERLAVFEEAAFPVSGVSKGLTAGDIIDDATSVGVLVEGR